jgi:hypothetical protein
MIHDLDIGTLHAGDQRVGQIEGAVEELMGECVVSFGPDGYCKFYGQGEVSVCDRSCGISIWDQI